MEKKTVRFGVSIEEDLLEQFDRHIADKKYLNRSEALRDLIRRTLLEDKMDDPDVHVFGTLTIIYNHHYGDISERLNSLQHDFVENIISTTHIHLDEHNCLEVLILKGPAGLVRELSNKILSTKNVKQGELVIASTGEEGHSHHGHSH